MTLHDISIAVGPGTPEWPGDTPWSCTWAWRMADGASVNVSCLHGSPHVGTHADAPLHVQNGAGSAVDLPLTAFLGPATVVAVDGGRAALHPSDLPDPERIAGGRLLLCTGRSIATGSFPDTWPTLTDDCLQALLAGGLILLGVDTPSVDARDSTSLRNHHRLFDAGACILENLDLRGVAPGDYELVAAPLKLEGADAAPVRALLRGLAPSPA